MTAETKQTSRERDLTGKTALITGASKGIGRSIALMLAAEGVNVILVARPSEELDATVAAVQAKGVTAKAAALDVTDAAAAEKLAGELQQEQRTVEILINNVGVGKYGKLSEHSVADYDWMMNTNMRSTFIYSRFFVPPMLARGDGDVIFVGSVAGLKGLPGESVYCASKNAQVAFAHALDYECRERNVRVGVLAPGGVDTHFAMGTGRKPGMPILKKMLRGDDVAAAALFLLKQPPTMRYFVVGVRPMHEAL